MQHYTAAYRADAVRLVAESGQSIRKTAQDLGVAESTLKVWVAKARSESLPSEHVSEDERAELVRLRKDNATLRMERDFLKKAATWFASHTQ